MRETADVVVLGAGHNGLVAAAYLARAGLSVTVVEARPVLGGACATEELVPGFRFSSTAVVLSLLWPKIIRELELKRFGLHYYRTGVDRIGIWENGRVLVLYPELDRQLAALARLSGRDPRGLVELGVRVLRFAALYEPTLLGPPPTLEAFRSSFRGADAALFDEFVLGSIRALVERYFESPEARGFFAFPGMVSVDASPDTPGTAYVYGHHAVGGLDGQLGVHGFVRGGMGGITRALSASARSAGAEILAGVPAVRILVEGRTLPAARVVSNADVRRTLLELVGAEQLAPDVAKAVASFDCRGSMARVHLALSELPRYEAVPQTGSAPVDVHRAFTLLGADLARFARAHDAQVRGEIPDDPVLEVTIPSAHDPTLAPAGMHTLTLGVMHVPHRPATGTWDDHRDRLGDAVVERLCAFAPNVATSIVDRRVATPLDLERTFGLPDGNIFQGAMTPAQLFASRPLPGWSAYRLPVRNLYLCGSSAHPGGAVSGAPGHNAATEVMRDTRDGPIGPGEWQARASAVGRLPRQSRRGTLLYATSRTSVGARALRAVAQRRVARPLVRRVMTGS
jgi:phytoene dehydrogenase-like protein